MGSRAKITPQQIWIIGVVLTIISAVVIYFTLMKPAKDAYDLAEADYQTQLATAQKQDAANKDRKDTLAAKALAEAKWAVYDKRFMPDIDISNRFTAMKQLWREEILVLQPKLDAFLRADHSVTVVSSAFTMPTPPSDPNQVVTKQLTIPLGTVTVVGTFNDVLNNAARWNKFDRLILMDGLTLNGSSPHVQATYTLTCYEFMHGVDKVGQAFPPSTPPTASTSGTSTGSGGYEIGAPGGGPGGQGGGFSGGPPASPSGRGGAALPRMSSGMSTTPN